jgi:flagellar biosynthesis GTPase FlhF
MFQTKRDQIDLYGQYHGVLAFNGNTKLKKEDENAIKDAEKENTRLSAILADVESKQESETERFKKELDHLIPQLNEEVHNLTEESKLPQYLDKNSDNNEMIKQLDEKMEKFKQLHETSIKYMGWQEELRTQPTIFQNIEDLKMELENRHQLWHSLQDWQLLKEGYEKKLWNDIDDEEIKRNADHYQKITNKLIRNLPVNPIVDELKYLVDTFKEAMPIVEACRNKNLTIEHWEAINDLIPNGKIDIEDENFTLQSLIDLDVNQY